MSSDRGRREPDEVELKILGFLRRHQFFLAYMSVVMTLIVIVLVTGWGYPQ